MSVAGALEENRTCGPIKNPHLHVIARPDGVCARGYRWRNPPQVAAPHSASWIGARQPEPPSPVVLFRREFTLAQVPRSVDVLMSADVKYRLWINGTLASRGPDDIGMDYNRTTTGKWFFDVCDFTRLLHTGMNVIAAEVFAEPPTGWENSIHPGHLCLELRDGEQTLLKSDAEWRAKASDYWRRVDEQWTYDGLREPPGWRLGGFDESGWPQAEVVLDVWQPLVMSEIPACMETIYPISCFKRATDGVRATGDGLPVVFDHDGGITVRFNRVLPAFISLRLRGGEGGVLHIEANEPDEPGYHRAASIQLNSQEQIVELPYLDSFSVINLRAEHLQQPLTLLDVRATFASQPVDYRGQFACSDPELTRLWDVCRWVTQICLQTHHLDSPHHQEPISDPGDYLIESLVNYACFFQPALTRQDLRKYAWIMGQRQNHVFHTSYALLWLQMLTDYYNHTGDAALVQELGPAVFSLLDTFTGYRGQNGLISEAPNYMFMDWVGIGEFSGHHPPAVIGQGYLTAFYYRALADAAQVARITGEHSREARYNQLRDEVLTAFNRELWSEEKGLYRDGKPFQTHVPPGQWLPADKDMETFTPHVNVLAVLYDLAPKARQVEILERSMNGPDFDCQMYFMHFVFEALAHVGLFDKLGVPQMKRWHIVEETQSLREMWTTGDLSHGWGASPGLQLSTRVLGVQVESASHVIIAPLVCGLAWAEGVVPTQKGDVKVHWKVERGVMHLTVSVPLHCTAEIRLPGLVKQVGAGEHRLLTPVASE